MKKYQAAAITAPKKIKFIEKTIPKLSPGEVLVKIKTCCICTLEKRLYTGALKIFYPIVGGHEVSGVVEKTTSDNLQVGDKVVLDLINRCGECYFCRRGFNNHCLNQFKGGKNVLGGFSEYIVVSSRQVFKINPSIDFDFAALTEPLSDCMHSCMQAGLSPLDTVMISGAGTMGLLHLIILKKYGVRTIVTDVDNHKLNVAKSCGADFLINIAKDDLAKKIEQITLGRGVNIAFITSSGKEPVLQALHLVAVKGSIVLYAANYPNIEIPLDANLLHYKEIKLVGSEGRTGKDFFKAVDFQNASSLNLAPVISARYKFSDIKKALEASLDPRNYRIALEMDA